MLYEQFYENVRKTLNTERLTEINCYGDYTLYKLKNLKQEFTKEQKSILGRQHLNPGNCVLI